MNMRRVRWIAWKELLQFRRDRLLMPIVFIMPIVQLLLFGYVVGADVTNLPTAVVTTTTPSRRATSCKP